jgi:glycosyltransferase involved in cell wall biosynthesis
MLWAKGKDFPHCGRYGRFCGSYLENFHHDPSVSCSGGSAGPAHLARLGLCLPLRVVTGVVNEASECQVSIVTPAFNAAAHLGEMIESVLAQTYRDFELLIVDDGSTDRTAAIAASYCGRDRRIVLCSTSNRGPSGARNLALRQARGAYIAFLDSDDLWQPDYLAAQLRTLVRHPNVDVVTSNAINLGGVFDGRTFWPASNQVREITLLEMIRREDAVHIMSVVRRSVIDRAGYFDECRRGNEDYQFWLRAAVAGCRFVADFTPRAYYRRRPESLSADERVMLTGILDVYRELRPRCQESEARAIDAQVRRFDRELLIAEARACMIRGDGRLALAYLRRIPRGERGPVWTLTAGIASLWPNMLSYAYRARRAFHAARVAAFR